jgi:hypothetical protein
MLQETSHLENNLMNEQETYEYLVDYLVENDFVDAENADKIILHMSEEWYADIIEASCGSKPKKVRKKMVTEDEDSLRDRRMERGGVDGNTRYDRAPKAPNTKKFGTGKTMAQKEMEKKYGKGATAMDVVRANITAKYGKGAIMDPKDKK